MIDGSRQPNRADKAASKSSGLPAFFYYLQRTRNQRTAETWLSLFREAQRRGEKWNRD